jgi:hypothetical protein
MRSYFFIVLFLLISVQISYAQPTKSVLNSPPVVLELATADPLNPSSLTFLPDEMNIDSKSGFLYASQHKPGVAMLSSAVIPGAGQALNGKWGRAAVYVLAEALSIAYYVDRNNQAKRNERAYETYANRNWSVLAYAQWLVDYSKANDLINGYEQLENQLNQLSPGDQSPNYANTTEDWRKVNLSTLREVEVQTRFVFDNPEGCGSVNPSSCEIRSEFSHVVQDYGSQQYYELMSKYYQFQPGWEDFHEQRLAEGSAHTYQYSWNRSMITPNFIEGRDRAEEFNSNYRQAGNILKFLVVNHVISAFDAFFTVKLKNSRLETSANLLQEESFSLTWHF